MLGCRAELDPLVAESGSNAAVDHRVEDAAACLVAHAMMEVAARAHFLERRKIAALVVYAGEAVPHELLRDVCEPVAIALRGLVGGKRRPLADATQCATRAIGDATGEVAGLVLVEGTARRIRRVLRDAGQLERLRVVERRV